jgi:ADP-ribosylglycohydrolase
VNIFLDFQDLELKVQLSQPNARAIPPVSTNWQKRFVQIAVAAAIFLGRKGESKKAIREYVEGNFGYNLHNKLDEIRPGYYSDPTCQGSVPQAITAFLESRSYEKAVRNAVSLGGDSDTMACIAGGVVQAYYWHIPDDIVHEARKRLEPELLNMVDLFSERYGLLSPT